MPFIAHTASQESIDLYEIPFLSLRAVPGFQSHHGRLHDCDGHVRFALCVCNNFGGRDTDGLSDADRSSSCHKSLADCGGEEIDFELHAEHGGAFGHACQTCVAAGRICDGGDCACVYEAVLLLDGLRPRQLNIDLAVRDAGQLRAQRAKQLLTVE